MTRQAVDSALDFVASVPSGKAVARRLRRATIILDPALPDRAQTRWQGHIILGPEPFKGSADTVRVSLAGTLVHEAYHLRQHPLLKTRSFWLGILTRTHPMRRYEAPAYAAQQAFLAEAAVFCPALAELCQEEIRQSQAAFSCHYAPRG